MSLPPPPTPDYRVLIIDDTESIHADFRKVLATPVAATALRDLATAVFGSAAPAIPAAPTFSIDSALQGQEGLALVEAACAAGRPYAVAFVDMRMPPGWDGLETINRLWGVDRDLQVVICTAYSDHSWNTITQRLGRSHNLLILKKPFDHIEALQLAHALATKWDITRANRAHVAELDQMVDQRTSQLQAAEARFAEAFNANPLPQVIIAHEPAFRILSVNLAFQRQLQLNLDDLNAASPLTFGRGLDPFKWQALINRLKQGEQIDEYPFTYRPSPHVERHLRCSARATTINGHRCSIWLIRDVTQQLDTEQQLRQSQKLEAIGQLSAGVAHDFNNLLTVIHGYTAELLATHPDAEVQRMLGPVQDAAARAASLTRQLLIFSRKQIVQPELILFNTVLDGLRPLLRRLIGTDIEMIWDVPPDLPPVLADPASLEQIIVNLVVNARDAMPEGGRIHVAAALTQVNEAAAARQVEARPGDYIEIRVTDTGSGIPPEVLARIFEPFFTTKEAGKGTGLGLSTVYSIVRQHGGWLNVQSQVGSGSTFTIFQPVAPPGSQVRPAAAPVATPAAPPATYRRVLVAEDDPVIQELLTAVLKRRGIKFDLAPDGVSALALWNEHPGAHDLLITDVVMPNGMSGIRLAQEIRRQRPDLPLIMMTGYSAALAEPKTLDEIPGKKPRLLMKPFVPNDLFEAIYEAAAVSPAGPGP